MRATAAALIVAGALACSRSDRPARKVDAGAAAARAIDAGPSGPEIVVLDRILVEESFWPPEAGPPPDKAKLTERIGGELGLSNLFVLPMDVPSGTRVKKAKLRAAYGVEVVPASGSSPVQVRAAFSLQLEWPGDPETPSVQESALCDKPLAKEVDAAAAAPEAAQLMLDCAITGGLSGLIEKEKVCRGDEEAVLAALDSEDPSLRAVAFAAVGDHQLRAATPRLLELLGSEDVYARDGAIGALVALREQKAVKALTEMVQFRDLDMLRRVIDAVGTIGGDEARSYLEFIATGHDVPEVRELAKQALDRLQRREGATPR
jgi:hypothetical protein